MGCLGLFRVCLGFRLVLGFRVIVYALGVRIVGF